MGFLSQEDNKESFLVKTNEQDFRLEQDVSKYIDYAAKLRQSDEHAPTTRQYRSFAIIPDIVAVDILTKYHIDVHSDTLMSDPATLRRLKNIIMMEYPKLLTSNVKSV